MNDNVKGGNDELFVDSNSDSDISVVNPLMTKKGYTNTVSGKKG